MTQMEHGGIVPANDNGPCDPAAKARCDELVFALASALGRQIAREEFARRKHGRAALKRIFIFQDQEALWRSPPD